MCRISRIAVTLTLFMASAFFNAFAETPSADSLCGDAESARNALKDKIRSNVKPRPGLALIQLETLVATWPSERAHCSKILQKLSASKDVQAAANLRRALEAATMSKDTSEDKKLAASKWAAIAAAIPFVKSAFLGVANEITELLVAGGVSREYIPNINVDMATSIIIIGDDEFIGKTRSALSLIEEKAPGYYTMVTNCIPVILRGNASNISASAPLPICQIGPKTFQAKLTWYASGFVHEAYHSKLYNDYVRESGCPVPANIWTGREAENSCLSAQEDFLKIIHAPEYQIRYVRKMRNVDYFSSKVKNTW